ncbi:MAG: trypsin-like serine protease, partial [Bdellovibrionales bacterium]|nr:trypsin-like serine protease [Bdellovibrionales bacterium]
MKSADIVSGTEVDSTQVDVRFIVNLSDSCAGSIIAPSWILTAGHCKPAFKNITAGGTDLFARKRISLRIKK